MRGSGRWCGCSEHLSGTCLGHVLLVSSCLPDLCLGCSRSAGCGCRCWSCSSGRWHRDCRQGIPRPPPGRHSRDKDTIHHHSPGRQLLRLLCSGWGGRAQLFGLCRQEAAVRGRRGSTHSSRPLSYLQLLEPFPELSGPLLALLLFPLGLLGRQLVKPRRVHVSGERGPSPLLPKMLPRDEPARVASKAQLACMHDHFPDKLGVVQCCTCGHRTCVGRRIACSLTKARSRNTPVDVEGPSR